MGKIKGDRYGYGVVPPAPIPCGCHPYSHITPEATMVVEKAFGRDSPLRQGAGKSSWILLISF
jgi:hypothetical protein